MPKACPSRDELSGYARGTLLPPQADAVTEHLAACPNCEETLHDLAAVSDSLIDQIKAAPTVEAYVDEPACLKVVSSIERQAAAVGPVKKPTGVEQAATNAGPQQVRPMNRTEFVEFLTTAGFVSPNELTALEQQLPPAEAADVQALARVLVQQGKLTKYQAAAVYQGKGKSLIFGEHVVIDRIGAGGMGQVYKARHRRMDRIVALKVMSPAAMKNADSVKRFEREVRAVAKLAHPNIVNAHDASVQDGVHYLVMEFVDGPDLSSLVKKQGKLPVKQACDFIAQAARGFAFAHGKGIIHRDIKPGNLLVDGEGTVKILDMGLARFDDGGVGGVMTEAELTQSGAVMGTVDYMAPEQAMNTRHADAKSDVYGLGCTLYKLLTGEPVYGGQTMVEKIFAHKEKPIPALRQHRPDASPALEALVTRMLAKDPTQRPTMQEVADQLAAIDSAPLVQTARPPMASAVPPTAVQAPAMFGPPRPGTGRGAGGEGPALGTRVAPPKRRNRVPLLAAAGAGAILLAFGIWIIIKDKNNNEVARVQVADGATVEIKPSEPGASATGGTATGGPATGDRKQEAGVGSSAPAVTFNFPTVPPITVDPALERRAAVKFLEIGGVVSVTTPEKSSIQLRDVKLIPAGTFTINSIDLRNSKTTDADLLMLRGLAKLHALRVPQTNVTDAGLEHVRDLTTLTELRLNDIRITDAGLKHLEGLRQLQTLELKRTQVTSAGVAALQAKLPNCAIDSDATPPAAATPNVATSRAPTGSDLWIYPEALDPKQAVALFPSLHYDGSTPITIEGWLMPFPTTSALAADGTAAQPLRYTLRNIGIDHFTGSQSQLCWAWQTLHPVTDGDNWRLEAITKKDGVVTRASVSTGRTIPAPRNVPQHFAIVLGPKQANGTQHYTAWLDGKRIVYHDAEYAFDPTAPFYSQGFVDELRISRLERYSADFVPQRRFEPDADTIALYHCDEGSGDKLIDSSGNNHHGKLTNAKWAPVGSPPGTPVVASNTPGTLNAGEPPSTDSDRRAADWVLSMGGKVGVHTAGGKEASYEPGAGALPSEMFRVYNVYLRGCRTLTDAGLANLAGLTGLEDIDLSSTPITDDGLANLARITQLNALRLHYTSITDAGVIHLAALKKLTVLDLAGSKVTGSGLQYLAGLSLLQTINMDGASLTDEGLVYLERLSALQSAILINTYVTEAGAEKLRAKLPNCKITVKTRPGTPPALATVPLLSALPTPGATIGYMLPNVATLPQTPGAVLTFTLGRDVPLRFRYIPAGSFLMGSPPTEVGRGDDEQQHPVTLTRPFFLGETEVTNAQWQTAGTDKKHDDIKDGDRPHVNIRWIWATEFAEKLNQSPLGQSYRFRLPTEAEWEYACRAGTTTSRHFGDDPKLLPEYAWCQLNTGRELHAGGQLKPNAWGLYDMYGNVSEWCFDFYDAGYYAKGPQIDPRGPDTGEKHVMRGTAFGGPVNNVRSAFRVEGDIGGWVSYGFRLVCEPIGGFSVAAAAPAPSQTTVAPSTPIDLLSLVQLPRDVVKGKWTRNGTTLIGEGAYGSVQIPFTPPTDEYDLVLTGQQAVNPNNAIVGSGFQFGLVAQGRQFHLRVGRESCGISVDGDTAKAPYAVNKLDLPFEKPFVALCAVRKEFVRLDFNGRTVLEYRDDFKRLSVFPERAVPRTDQLFFGTNGELLNSTSLKFISVGGPSAASAAVTKPTSSNSRQPVPDTTAQQASLQTIKEVFKDEYAAAKTPEQRAQLGAKLVDQAKQTTNDPAARYVLLTEGRALAIDGVKADVLRNALLLITREYDVEEPTTFVDAWTELLKRPKVDPTTIKLLFDEASGLFDEAIVSARFDDAKRYGDFALSTSRRLPNSAAVVKATTERNAALVARQKEWEGITAAAEKLAATPDDADANAVIGRYRALVGGDWAGAFALLAKGSDETLKGLAAKSLAVTPGDSAAQVATGDAWWDAAQSAKAQQRTELLAGAHYWYSLANPALNGLAKARVEKRIADATAGLPTKKIPATTLPSTLAASSPTPNALNQGVIPTRGFGEAKPATVPTVPTTPARSTVTPPPKSTTPPQSPGAVSPRSIAERIIAMRGNVQIADPNGVEKLAKAVTDLPPGDFDIVEVTCNYGTGIVDADLQAFATLTKLRELRIQNSNITGSGFVFLRGLPKLTYLAINRCPLNDAHLDHLAAMTNLTGLDIVITPITDAGLAKLQNLTALEDVHLGQTAISDAGMRFVQRWTTLDRLTLDDTAIGDAGVDLLSTHPKLRVLSLRRTRITDRCVPKLAQIKTLGTLYLIGCSLSAGAVDALKKQFPGDVVKF